MKKTLLYTFIVIALVAELVDAHASGACRSTPVEVQVLFRAPIKSLGYILHTSI